MDTLSYICIFLILLLIPFIIYLFFLKKVYFVFIILLPFHSLLITILLAKFDVSLGLLKVIAGWKEIVLLGIFLITILFIIRNRQPISLMWIDFIAIIWFFQVILYFAFQNCFTSNTANIWVRLYGARDWLVYLLPYFIGRWRDWDDNILVMFKLIVSVGIVICSFGIIEYLFIPTDWHIALGVPKYFKEFLNLDYSRFGGLPPNYWVFIGTHLARRSVSTFLSSQGFAIFFLIIIPVFQYCYLTGFVKISRFFLMISYTSLILTITRMTIVSCIIQSLILLWLLKKKRQAINVLVMLVFVVCMGLILNSSFRDFVFQTLFFQDSSSRSRPSQWVDGINLLLSYPLGLGIGAGGQTGARFGIGGMGSEAGYFKITSSLGFIGLVLFLLWFMGIMRASYAVFYKMSEKAFKSLGIVTLIIAIGMLINNLTAPLDESPFFIYIFSWLAGITVRKYCCIKSKKIGTTVNCN